MNLKRFYRFSCGLMAVVGLSLASARAQWVTQTLQLTNGWNAVFLHVDASYNTIDNLVGNDGNNPIQQIWRWNPTLRTQYIDTPATPTPTLDWVFWTRTNTAASPLQGLIGDSAYLVYVGVNNYSVTPYSYTWKVKGKPVPPRHTWTVSGMNFVGFPTVSNAPPKFDVFLAQSPALQTITPEIDYYPGGELVAGRSPMLLPSALFFLQPVTRGQAYWMRSGTVFNNYFGPFEVASVPQGGLNFSTGGSQVSFRLNNLTTNILVITGTLSASDSAPTGQAAFTNLPPLLVKGAINMTNLTYGYTTLSSGSPATWTLAPMGQPGDGLNVTLGLDRSTITQPAGSLLGGVLTFTDSLGFLSVPVPISATVGSLGGLWVGQASISQVGQYLKLYPPLVTNTTPGSAGVEAGINAAAAAVGLPSNGAEIPGAVWQLSYSNPPPANTLPVYANYGFETDVFTSDSGLALSNKVISGWLGSADKVGLNPVFFPSAAPYKPYANDGAIPEGTNTAFLLRNSSLALTLTNLSIGRYYGVTYKEDAARPTLLLDGAGYGVLPPLNFLGTSNFTLEAWVYPNAAVPNSSLFDFAGPTFTNLISYATNVVFVYQTNFLTSTNIVITRKVTIYKGSPRITTTRTVTYKTNTLVSLSNTNYIPYPVTNTFAVSSTSNRISLVLNSQATGSKPLPGLVLTYGSSVKTTANGGDSLPTNTWTHLAVVFNTTNFSSGLGNAVFYTNGVFSSVVGGLTVPTNCLRYGNYIGNSPWLTNALVRCALGTVRIWNTNLSPASVQSAMSTRYYSSGTSNLLAQYTFTEAARLAYDSSGRTNNLTLAGTAATTVVSEIQDASGPGSPSVSIPLPTSLSFVADFNTPSLLLTGTPIGNGAGGYAYYGNTANSAKYDYSKAFDGNTLTATVAGPRSNPPTQAVDTRWVGLDLGAQKIVTSFAFFPQGGYETNLVGGRFQVANTADFSDAVTLLTLTNAPSPGWTTNNPGGVPVAARYIRYVGSTNGFINIAELQFFGYDCQVVSANHTVSTFASGGAYSTVSNYFLATAKTMNLVVQKGVNTTNGSTPLLTDNIVLSDPGTNFNFYSFGAVASSRTGTLLLAGDQGGKSRLGGLIYLSPDGGQTWQGVGPVRLWSSLSCSDGGNVILAAVTNGPLYLSTDYGQTWGQTAVEFGLNHNWVRVCVSGDGSHLAAAWQGGKILLSTNSGANWQAAYQPSGSGIDTDNWAGLVISSDGTQLVAGLNPGSLFRSADFGQTWKPASLSTLKVVDMSASGDTTNLLIAVSGGPLYVSRDGGFSITPAGPLTQGAALSSTNGSPAVYGPSVVATNQAWVGVSSSSDGRHLLAATASTNLYTSEDYGLTWTNRSPVNTWTDVAMSSDGTHLLACAYSKGGTGPVLAQLSRGFTQYSLDSNTGFVIQTNGVYLFALNTNLGAVSKSYPLRLIIHNPTNGGPAVLLQRVFVGLDAQTNAVIANSESLLNANYLSAARRITAVHLPWSPANTPWSLGAPLSRTATFSTSVSVDYNDRIANPFVHGFHPDHDNLDSTFTSVLPRGSESYGLTRQINMQVGATGSDYDSRVNSAIGLTGTYTETLTVLGLGSNQRVFQTGGTFSIQRMSDNPVLQVK